MNLPYSSALINLPGHKGYRRMMQSIMRSLVQAALAPKRSMPTAVKIVLFYIVPEYACAVEEAATRVAGHDVLVQLSNDAFVVDKQTLMMLFVDYLVIGYAAFEVAGDTIAYADPMQFTDISLLPDGSISVNLANADVSDKVGIVLRCSNPFQFGKSVPELIPTVFMFLLSYHSRVLYELSTFKKPDLLILTSETMSTEEILSRRRRLLEQAEEDYGSFILMTHSSEDKPQVVTLDKTGLDADIVKSIYPTQVELLRQACGLTENGRSSYAITQFFANLENELKRLLPEAAISVSRKEDTSVTWSAT